MKTEQRNVERGFSLFDLLLVVATVMGIVFVILPRMARSRATNHRMTCVNNLKQIGIAFRGWSLDNGEKFEMPMQMSVTNGGAMELAEQGSVYAVFSAISNDLVSPRFLFCPEDRTPRRRMATVWPSTPLANGNISAILFTETNNISYFVGLDASEIQPAAMLAGDDHFLVKGVKSKPGLLLLQTNATVEWRNERHPKQGNIAFADASVQSLNTPAFRTALAQTGLATNRLAMP